MKLITTLYIKSILYKLVLVLTFVFLTVNAVNSYSSSTAFPCSAFFSVLTTFSHFHDAIMEVV
jgi:hypothetical protein